MSTPQFFEIPSTGTYRLTDGTAAYQFTEGDMIPMSLAIALGIEGAEYDAVPVFDAAQVAAIEALIAESGGGGGGGATFYSASYTGFAANDADGWLSIFKAPVAGSMTAVYFMPAFAITGHDTDRRDIEIYRASPTGTFGSRAAHHDFTAAAGAFAHNQVTLALSATPANLALSAGDYALFKSDTNGAGSADVIGLVVIEFTPD